MAAPRAPITPISAINRALRGRAPPTDLLPHAQNIVNLRQDATPGVTGSVADLMSTAMSPEEGTLTRDECKEELGSLVKVLQRRCSARLAIKKISDERERLLGEAERERKRERTRQGIAPWVARREGMKEAQEALFEVRKGKRMRRDTSGKARYVST